MMSVTERERDVVTRIHFYDLRQAASTKILAEQKSRAPVYATI